jgi:hypothetical protein
VKADHIRNVEERRERIVDLIDNSDRLARLIKRVDHELRGSDVKRSTDDLVRLVQVDVPELIEALRAEKINVRNLQAALRLEREYGDSQALRTR